MDREGVFLFGLNTVHYPVLRMLCDPDFSVHTKVYICPFKAVMLRQVAGRMAFLGVGVSSIDHGALMESTGANVDTAFSGFVFLFSVFFAAHGSATTLLHDTAEFYQRLVWFSDFPLHSPLLSSAQL